jgi:integrase
MKLPNGTGTVLKLSGHRRKPYAAVVTDSWVQIFDDDGKPCGAPKQKRKYIGFYATRKEAIRALSALDAESSTPAENVRQTQAVEPKRYIPTFGQMWKETYKMHHLEWAHETERNHLKTSKICEPLNHYRIDELNYQILQKFCSNYAKKGKTIGMMRLLKCHISLICNEAIKFGYIESNPVHLVTIKGTKDTKLKHPLSADTIRKIVQSECRTRDTLLILIYTGMRVNELINIKHENIHPDDGYMIGGEKTESSKNRIIPIHPFIVPLVKKWKERQEFKSDSAFAAWLAVDCKQYGETFSSHYCRHTFASLAAKYGMNVYITKMIMGHAVSNSDVTGSVYTHADKDTLIEEVKKIPFPNDL